MKRQITTMTLAATALLVLSIVACAEESTVKELWDTDDPTIVKKSRHNICHDQSSATFVQTEHFKAYRTMKDCVQSGGRPAKD